MGTRARAVVVLASVLLASRAASGVGAAGPEKPTFLESLKATAVPPEVIEGFLRGPGWARFDPGLGDRLGNFLPTDGIDRSATISTAGPDGARTSFMFAGRPCRINTHGDRFTECHQVSDGETRRESLAAHLGEPIRNVGMGGFGAYQAYRRMVREERTGHGAEDLNIYDWGDDHIRSLLRRRHAVISPRWNDRGGRMFHNNLWPNLERDLDADRLVEKLLVVHFDPPRALADLHQGRPRYDQVVVDHLAAGSFDVFDMNEVHLRDFRRSDLPYADDLGQFLTGHDNPSGNHVFADVIKDKVVGRLDPKPVTTRPPDTNSVDFRGYLPAGVGTNPGGAARDTERP